MAWGFPSLQDIVRQALATPADMVRSQRAMEAIAGLLAEAPDNRARYFQPGLMWPASKFYTIGEWPAIPPGVTQPNTFQISQPGVVVGILISGSYTDGVVSLEEQASLLTFQLDREATVDLSGNISQSTNTAQNGYMSARAMSCQLPWMPVLLPSKGSGVWTINIRNNASAGGPSIKPICNLGFLQGPEAYHRACALLTEMPSEAVKLR